MEELLEDAPVEDENVTFASLGLAPELCQATEKMGFKVPTKIQKEAIPYAIQGDDLWNALLQENFEKGDIFISFSLLYDLFKSQKDFFQEFYHFES